MTLILSDIDCGSELKWWREVTLLLWDPGAFDWPTWQLRDTYNYNAIFLLWGSWKEIWWSGPTCNIFHQPFWEGFQIQGIWFFFFLLLDCVQDKKRYWLETDKTQDFHSKATTGWESGNRDSSSTLATSSLNECQQLNIFLWT